MCSICGDKTHEDRLDDDFSDLFGTVEPGIADTEFAKAALSSVVADPIRAATFEEPCTKCRGSGRFVGYTGRVLGACFTCKGTGVQVFKHSAETREANRNAVANRKAAKLQAWFDANPAETEWLRAAAARGFNFAADQLVALAKYGDLNESRMTHIRNFMAKDFLRAEAKAAEQAALDARPAQIVGAPLAKIETAFATAMEAGIKRPKLRLDTFIFSPAPTTGTNAGAIYVKSLERENDSGERMYLGKIVEGKFVRVRDCSAEEEQRIVAAAMDPAAAAKAYGQRTGTCSICGRALTRNESIDRAMGPICADRYGW